MLPLQATEEAIWAMDNDEAGPNGLVRVFECIPLFF